jgi:hypothetical protein
VAIQQVSESNTFSIRHGIPTLYVVPTRERCVPWEHMQATRGSRAVGSHIYTHTHIKWERDFLKWSRILQQETGRNRMGREAPE